MNFKNTDLLLYAVTDRSWLKEGQTLTEVCGEVLDRGATFLQLREKDLDDGAFLAQAKELAALCQDRGVPFVVNDRVDIALASGADGVHVGQSDIRGRDIRALIGPDKLLGISAGTVEEALAAQAAGADYLGVGAVFGTATKKNARTGSLDQLRAICAAVSIPVVAIGGIHGGNLAQLHGTGADGIAVISAIFAADAPGAATATLRDRAEHIFSQTRCAIFDLDGTLIDSLGYWSNLAAEYLAGKGIAPVPEHILEAIRPMTLSQSADLFRREFGLDGDPEAEMTAMLADHYRDDIPLHPGVRELLDALDGRGVRMCVASATAAALMEPCLERLGVRDRFEFLLSCEDVGAGKDRPDVYLEAARRLGTDPAEITVYEDADYALETAKNAGFRTIDIREVLP